MDTVYIMKNNSLFTNEDLFILITIIAAVLWLIYTALGDLK